MIDSLNTLVRKIARDYDSDMEMKRSFALGLRFEQLKVLKKACVLNQNRKPRAKNMSGHNLSPREILLAESSNKIDVSTFLARLPLYLQLSKLQ